MPLGLGGATIRLFWFRRLLLPVSSSDLGHRSRRSAHDNTGDHFEHTTISKPRLFNLALGRYNRGLDSYASRMDVK
ncbi:hypothetical protein M3J09_002332 [Ascochyta lentis]